MPFSSRTLLVVAGMAAVACQTNTGTGLLPLPPAPQNLSYLLDPSGNPDSAAGILLFWSDVQDPNLQSYRIYSRGSTSGSFGLRAETTSNTFHDNGMPHLQYFVTAVNVDGEESAPSGTVTVNEFLQIGAPSALTGITLDSAIHLDWNDTPDLARFKWYRVYSSAYAGGTNPCPAWVLEGTTVSHEFLASQLPNGVTRCFEVSAVDTLGYESLWAPGPWTDTPRPDARNVLVWGLGVGHDAQSGFRFWNDLNNNGYGDPGELGLVEAGTATDVDFAIHVHADSTLWIVPVWTGTQLQLYSANAIADLTSIDLAPASGYTRDSLQARPGFGYVFAIVDGTVLHYGGLRMTFVGRQYAIFDWSVQTAPSNPDLVRMRQQAVAIR
jgi:fibronectin type 3 domain-containing protein